MKKDDDEKTAGDPIDPEVLIQIPAAAVQLKQMLIQMKKSCEEREGGRDDLTRKIGADIVKLLTGKYRDFTNIACMGALAATLVYIMNETERRSFAVAMDREGLLPAPLCAYCRKRPGVPEISAGSQIFCCDSCKSSYLERALGNIGSGIN